MTKAMYLANYALTRGVAYGHARQQASLSEDAPITPLNPFMTFVLVSEEAQPSGSVNNRERGDEVCINMWNSLSTYFSA